MARQSMFGFEARGEGGWLAEYCGEQNFSNMFALRSQAEEELPRLASRRRWGVDVADLRIAEWMVEAP
jgi:hypothetical protein